MTVTEWRPSQIVETRAEARTSWSAPVVEEQDGRWTVRDVETGIFGTGPDAQAAHRDFERALREHRDVLERQEELSPELTVQLAYLRELIG